MTSYQISKPAKNILVLSNVSFQHSNGESQFSNIHLSLPSGITGLVGDNGAGKSLLADIIRGSVNPTSGKVELNVDLIFLGQQAQATINPNHTVADILGASAKLAALIRIEQGSVCETDFNTVNDDWLFAENFAAKLTELSPRVSPSSLLSSLSPGELSKVMLLNVFKKANKSCSLLLLDEPSNHLDMRSKAWLTRQLQALDTPCLLISHDLLLLELCQHIASLNTNGLHLFKGNYTAFKTAKNMNDEARERQLKQIKADKTKANLIAQRDTEKAQKRASHGVNKAKQGGQPKVLIGAKKNKAQGAIGSKMSQHDAKLQKLDAQQDALQNQEKAHAIKFAFSGGIKKSKQLVQAQNLVSPHIISPVTLRIFNNEKWHLHGANGTGKSSFLHLLHGIANTPTQLFENTSLISKNDTENFLSVNTQSCFLDQHCSLLINKQNLVDNLIHYCKHLNQQDLRTLLASNGFRKDRVFQDAGSLSGGERMRLAMLIASHQPDCLLLLDEPDNHLDISSKTILADALRRFEGSYVLVSHDADFVAQCGVTNTYELAAVT